MSVLAHSDHLRWMPSKVIRSSACSLWCYLIIDQTHACPLTAYICVLDMLLYSQIRSSTLTSTLQHCPHCLGQCYCFSHRQSVAQLRHFKPEKALEWLRENRRLRFGSGPKKAYRSPSRKCPSTTLDRHELLVDDQQQGGPDCYNSRLVSAAVALPVDISFYKVGRVRQAYILQSVWQATLKHLLEMEAFVETIEGLGLLPWRRNNPPSTTTSSPGSQGLPRARSPAQRDVAMAIAGSLTSVFSRSSPVSPPLSSSAIRNVKAQHPMFCVRGTAARYQGVPKVLNGPEELWGPIRG
ncbi:hypothetical protein BCR41DRAFT_370187 [Lobosporangium transversale]|uniref:Uncharacterized protein n=1 Tax=Lobosporangium transversale TaxID=64571 RepID=A0A1Y2GRC4_9FUNG|nr:hypothetical protein BCR41DRAFT_370187 [Lobosporangium transversale]ORZ18396.1 hypothetical protein BCR41DRAFT_370187 [Lobosporangium transversale]|eukprot:XP_021882191.1 hypothetical protein BCR41DRAFT_370187 [Lobosporangium transversale]